MRYQLLWILIATSLSLIAGVTGAEDKGDTATSPADKEASHVPVFEPPKVVEYIQADYPKEALAAGLQADVVAELEVDENGLVTGVDIKEPAGHGFDEAAEDAMYRFVFAPATRDGTPIAAKILYRYRFFLTEPASAEEVKAPPACDLVGTVTDMDGGIIVSASIVVVPVAPSASAEGKVEDTAEVPQEVAPATSDKEGKFSLSRITPGSYQLDIVAPGFKPLSSVEELEDGEIREVTYRLEPEEALYETVVRGRRPAREVTRREVTRREITRIPGTGGDALRSIQKLPGLARAPMGSGALIIRGSSPSDSSYYFDSIPIPMLYHFGGLTSIINSDLLESIEFYPGNFSVLYGGATGGVVEVFPKTPAMDRFHASVDADFIDASALVETPIGKNWSVAASARRSYIGNLLSAFMPKNEGMGFRIAPRYYDYQLITDYHPRGKDTLRLFFFGSDDKLVFVTGGAVGNNPTVMGNLNFRILFHQAQANWTHKFGKGISNTFNLGTGFQQSDSSFGTLFAVRTTGVPIYLRNELAYDEKRNVAIRIGIDSRFSWDRYSVRAPLATRSMEGEPMDPLTANEEMTETKGSGVYLHPGFYGELELRPVKKLALIGGARFDYFENVSAASIDPRLVTRYKLFEKTTLKGGIGLFHQAPQGVQSDKKFGNPNLELINAMHYSVGVEQDIIADLDVGVEGFYKNLKNMVVSSSDPAERYNNEGTGEVWGLELLLKRHPTERFFGWISYTLMRSQRVDHPGEKARAFDYDQTHILTIVASAVLGRGWEAGISFQLVTGNPDTPIIGSVFDADSDIYLPIYGQTNSGRMPTFHQLDFRIDKNWKWKYIKAAVYLDVLNIYNHENPEGYQYNYDYTQRRYFNGLPIIPSLGLKLEY